MMLMKRAGGHSNHATITLGITVEELEQRGERQEDPEGPSVHFPSI